MWMKIETAPQDQTPVDIWSAAYGRCVNMSLAHRNGEVFYQPVKGGPSCVRDATHWSPILGAPHN